MKTVNLILENFKRAAERSHFNHNVYTDGSRMILEDCDEYHNTLNYYWLYANGNREYIGYCQWGTECNHDIDSSDKVELELCTDYLT